VTLDATIDVSHVQGSIDFAAVAGAGIRLAIVKASEREWTDAACATNLARARAAGLATGAYHFAHAASTTSVARQAETFLRVANPGPGALCVLDLERPPARYGADPMSAADAKAWCEAVERITRAPVLLYGTAGYLDALGAIALRDSTVLGRPRPLWLARYPVVGAAAFGGWRLGAIPKGWAGGEVLLWQYTGWGRVAGIAGDVDRSVGNVDDVLALYPGARAEQGRAVA
jgi:GH25 family lysozyme M1 (1,4-beta-N-acetylmuramidase)